MTPIAISAQTRRITIMGLGRFGGGAGVACFAASQLANLHGRNAQLIITDLSTPDELRDEVSALGTAIGKSAPSAVDIIWRLGEHRKSDFTETDLVIANPAVPRPWSNSYLNAAADASVPVTTEIELLIQRLPNPQRVIGVTGTAGKSTTAAMIHHILCACCSPGQSCHLGGNIGGSLLNTTMASEDWVVLELSSAMLYWLGRGAIGKADHRAGWSPHASVITNLAPNHMDWHESFDHYRASKQQILNEQQRDSGAIAVLGPGCAAHFQVNPGIRSASIESNDPKTMAALEDILLRTPGEHNRLNACVARTLCEMIAPDHVDRAHANDALKTFRSLHHRLELIDTRSDGSRFYNDSKSTTPEATHLAVDAFGPMARRIHLIVGGYDKKVDLSLIAEQARRIAGLYAIGAVGPRIAQAARLLASPASECVYECGELSIAVYEAMSRMRPGDILLLSPGCASWDQFTNYEERGSLFSKLVRANQ